MFIAVNTVILIYTDTVYRANKEKTRCLQRHLRDRISTYLVYIIVSSLRIFKVYQALNMRVQNVDIPCLCDCIWSQDIYSVSDIVHACLEYGSIMFMLLNLVSGYL